MAVAKTRFKVKYIGPVKVITIPAGVMEGALSKAAKKRCDEGRHFFMPPHRRNRGGGRCSCPQKCIHCGTPQKKTVSRRA